MHDPPSGHHPHDGPPRGASPLGTDPGVRGAAFPPAFGRWSGGIPLHRDPLHRDPLDRDGALVAALDRCDVPVAVVRSGERLEAVTGGQPDEASAAGSDVRPLVAWLPAVPVSSLGDPTFIRDHGVSAAYVGGAMANGIASVELVTALAGEGLLGFFGAAGLTVDEVAAAIDRLSPLGDRPHGYNLIHSPNEPRVERELVELYLRRGVRSAEASAFLDLTPPVVRYRVAGVRPGPDGAPVPARRLMAKVSRREVARHFLSPPPAAILDALVREGSITDDEARLARHLPMCDDLTAEADSGGHTDSRPLITLLPSLVALAKESAREHGFARPVRVGAAGGIATPWSVHAAFSLGAAYVVLGSVHQSCVEAGTSDTVRALLAEAEPTDVAMAPAADMFEMGVELQVLRRGTMFPMRARKLYELYRDHDAWESIPETERTQVERTHFRASFDEVWRETRTFFEARDPAQVERAANDPKHRMALAFRWYLGLSSAWANRGDDTRRLDYQVWCGPAMGAFNEWARGSHLEPPAGRRVADVSAALLDGAARLERAHTMRLAGLELPADAPDLRPRPRTPGTRPAPARTSA